MWKGGLAASVLALTLSALTTWPAVGDEDPDSNPPPNRSDVPKGHESWYDDASELGNVGAHGRHIEADVGDRYADVWIDRTSNRSRFAVGIVDANTDDFGTVESITGLPPERLVILSAAFSSRELLGLNAAVKPIVQSRTETSAIWVDPSRNAVVIEVDSIPEGLKEEIAAEGIPSDAVVFIEGFALLQPTHSSYDQYPPYEGGLRVHIYPPGFPLLDQPCTTWFAGVSSGGGQYKGMTAGHCDDYEGNHAFMGCPCKTSRAWERTPTTHPTPRIPMQ